MSATNRGKKRQKNDFYPTPDWLAKPIMPVIAVHEFQGTQRISILEPACGKLGIVKELRAAFEQIRLGRWELNCSDLVVRVKGKGIIKRNFLTMKEGPRYDLIIANPPYILAQEFRDKARKMIRPHGLVVLLLRINFFGAQKRKEWWQEEGNLPSGLYISPRRPSFGKNKKGKKGTDATEYAWFVWGQDQERLEPPLTQVRIMDT